MHLLLDKGKTLSNLRSGQADAKARMYLRFHGEKSVLKL